MFIRFLLNWCWTSACLLLSVFSCTDHPIAFQLSVCSISFNLVFHSQKFHLHFLAYSPAQSDSHLTSADIFLWGTVSFFKNTTHPSTCWHPKAELGNYCIRDTALCIFIKILGTRLYSLVCMLSTLLQHTWALYFSLFIYICRDYRRWTNVCWINYCSVSK